MKLYLCGPIAGCTDSECKDWRDLVMQRYPDSHNPMVRDARAGSVGLEAHIVENDKLDIMHCDVVLVYYTKPSVGTSMEILFSWEQHKPVIVVDAAGAGDSLSPWIRHHSMAVVKDLESAFMRIDAMVRAARVAISPRQTQMDDLSAARAMTPDPDKSEQVERAHHDRPPQPWRTHA